MLRKDPLRQRVRNDATRLMRQLAAPFSAADVNVMPSASCAAMVRRHPSIAMDLDEVDAISESGASVVTPADSSCLHLGGMLARSNPQLRVMHLAEILASSGECL